MWGLWCSMGSIMLIAPFQTQVSHQRQALPVSELETIAAALLLLRNRSPGEKKSNLGGWHSSGNLFAPPHPQFPALNEAVAEAVLAYAGSVFEWRGQVEFSLSGWTVINGPGASNRPHNHPGSVLSGALYVRVPAEMQGGGIVFTDPRPNINLVMLSPEARTAGTVLPWESTAWTVSPQAGDLLVFPSWLTHHVEPFASRDPAATRIVISFNVCF